MQISLAVSSRNESPASLFWTLRSHFSDTGRRSGADWGGAWNTCLFARLERPEKFDQWFGTYLRSVNDNLHNHIYHQSDATYGMAAAVAEALLQSHAGEISLLPALPPSWSNGSVKGLRARGGLEVDIAWRDGKLTEATIHSLNGGSAKLRYSSETREIKLGKG